MSLDVTVLAVDGDSGEIAYMLVGACELVEECGLAAVLVSDEGKAYRAVADVLVVLLLIVIASGLTVAGVLGLVLVAAVDLAVVIVRSCLILMHGGSCRAYLYACGIGLAKGKLVSVDAQFHGVAHGGVLDKCGGYAGENAHVQEMLAKGTLASYACDYG